jgi:hypothetical protein
VNNCLRIKDVAYRRGGRFSRRKAALHVNPIDLPPVDAPQHG